MISRLLAVIVCIQPVGCSEDKPDEAVVMLPMPKKISLQKGTVCFADSLRVFAIDKSSDTLIGVLQEDIEIMFNFPIVRVQSESAADILMIIDSSLSEGEYQLEVASNIQLHAGSYKALAMASASLLQLFSLQNNQLCARQVSVRDQSDLAYRGLLIDVARRKHDISTLKQVVRLCRWYKINYLQIHLTDEQNFTFPSEAFPQLVTTDYHFSSSELRDLVEYSYARGVEIVPELEVPGHATQMVTKMPAVFGFKERDISLSTINMGRDTVYRVLDKLIEEIASVFYRSKYIHIGGDEANFENMEKARELSQFLRTNNLSGIDELYWHFINQMNSFVRKQGRQTIVWEGFSKEGNAVVDKNIIVMAWESIYQLPQDLLAGGYKIINVSWQPLYVVNNRKWSPKEIYSWNPYYWQNWVTHMPSYTPIQLEKDDDVIGGSMASWDQPEYTEIGSLRQRIPPMVENLWNIRLKKSADRFLVVLDSIDNKLTSYLSPVNINVKGLNQPSTIDGFYDEQTWFDSAVTITLTAPKKYTIRYTVNGASVNDTSMIFNSPLEFTEKTLLRYQAFDASGRAVGNASVAFFELRPLEMNLEAEFPIHPDTLWKTTRDWLVPYSDSIRISLFPKMSGELKYAITKNNAKTVWRPYSKPIVLSDTNILKVEAALFREKKQVGSVITKHFRRE